MINLHDYEENAGHVLPRHVWDWIAGGAMDEVVVRRNRAAFEALTLRPRYLRDVGCRDLTTTVLGREISMPIVLSPAGLQGQVHPDGEAATARAAAMAGTLMVAPTTSNVSLEDVRSSSSGPMWFQLYHHSRQLTEELVGRAEVAGFNAILVTIDRPIALPKERDVRNRDRPGATGLGMPGTTLRGVNTPDAAAAHAASDRPQLTWSDLAWLRSVTSLPLVLKGVMCGEDALLAVDHGAEGVFVSNHGGRLFDASLSSIELLPEVVEATMGRAEVYVDSGIRRGTDVLKALALGARAVGVGRPLFWGLAAGGSEGVHRVLELLRVELSAAMASCGQTSVRELDRHLVDIPVGWGPNRIV